MQSISKEQAKCSTCITCIIIAALQKQHEEDESTRTEMQEHIEKLETEINTMGRELEAARMRADTLAQVASLRSLSSRCKLLRRPLPSQITQLQTAKKARLPKTSKRKNSPPRAKTHSTNTTVGMKTPSTQDRSKGPVKRENFSERFEEIIPRLALHTETSQISTGCCGAEFI